MQTANYHWCGSGQRFELKQSKSWSEVPKTFKWAFLGLIKLFWGHLRKSNFIQTNTQFLAILS